MFCSKTDRKGRIATLMMIYLEAKRVVEIVNGDSEQIVVNWDIVYKGLGTQLACILLYRNVNVKSI
jgi:hypothetical protein